MLPGWCTWWGIHLPTTRVVYMVGICLPTTLGGVHGGIYASLLYIPGYTPYIHRPAHYWVHCSTVCGVRGGEALGSNPKNPMGESLSGTLKS